MAYLPEDPPEQLLSCVLAHSQIFSVRALETFFRDIFVLLCKRDSNFALGVAESTSGKVDFSTLAKLTTKQVDLEDLLAAEREFQNLDVVNKLFEPIFGAPLFDALESKPFDVIVPGDPPIHGRISLRDLPWRKELYDLFNARHELIHNANGQLPADRGLAARLAHNATLIGQLASILIGSKVGVGQLTTAVPLWQVIYVFRAGSKQPLSVDQAKEEATQSSTQSADQGHMGPAIIVGNDLLRLRFFEPEFEPTDLADDQPVIHTVDEKDGFIELRTLVGLTQSKP